MIRYVRESHCNNDNDENSEKKKEKEIESESEVFNVFRKVEKENLSLRICSSINVLPTNAELIMSIRSSLYTSYMVSNDLLPAQLGTLARSGLRIALQCAAMLTRHCIKT